MPNSHQDEMLLSSVNSLGLSVLTIAEDEVSNSTLGGATDDHNSIVNKSTDSWKLDAEIVEEDSSDNEVNEENEEILKTRDLMASSMTMSDSRNGAMRHSGLIDYFDEISKHTPGNGINVIDIENLSDSDSVADSSEHSVSQLLALQDGIKFQPDFDFEEYDDLYDDNSGRNNSSVYGLAAFSALMFSKSSKKKDMEDIELEDIGASRIKDLLQPSKGDDSIIGKPEDDVSIPTQVEVTREPASSTMKPTPKQTTAISLVHPINGSSEVNIQKELLTDGGGKMDNIGFEIQQKQKVDRVGKFRSGESEEMAYWFVDWNEIEV
jgi:hypothetical protein